jgi:ribonuclease J
VALSGIPDKDAAGDDMADLVRDVAEDVIRTLPRALRRDTDAMVRAVHRAVRAELAQAWGKKPVCQVLVLTL